jgi:ribonuclease VapC
MVIDTSAILAIIFKETDAHSLALKFASATERHVSAASLLETTIVLRRRTRSRDDRDLLNFLAAVPITIMPFDQQQYLIARTAFLQFGQASGHPAQLNFGDCFSYALAKHLNAPLLFKGNDFARTDLIVG